MLNREGTTAKRKYLYVALIALVVILLLVPFRACQKSNLQMSPVYRTITFSKAHTQISVNNIPYTISRQAILFILSRSKISWEPGSAISCPVTLFTSKAGSTDSHAGLHILPPWSNENLFTNMFRLKVRDVSLYMEPGENLYVYEMAEVTHASMYPVHFMVYSKLIDFDDAVICDKQPTVFVDYSVVTFNSTEERNQAVETSFTWEYSLRFAGRKIWTGTHILEIEHIVNA